MKAAFIDFETTGLVATFDKVIEGCVILMEYDENNNLTKLVDMYESFNDPQIDIPENIIKITMITNDLVKGKVLEWSKFNSLIDQADVVVAHNVKFDKSFLIQQGGYKGIKKYGCSMDMIDWKSKHGQDCRKLGHLAFEHGLIAEKSHRAIDDVKLLIKLLKQKTKGNPEITYFQEMMGKLNDKMFVIDAIAAPYEKKDLLKEKGFRWNAQHKYWTKKVPESELKEMVGFLTKNVYPLNRYKAEVKEE